MSFTLQKTMTPAITPNALLAVLNWRYATKQFDPAQKIPAETWAALEQSLVLTPSSFGLQPWKFFIITDQETKDRLVPLCWNQRQVADCSHLVVMTALLTLDEAYVDRFIARTAHLNKTEPETLSGYRSVIVNDVVFGERSKIIQEWAHRQSYIALGQFMLAAAALGVDTCPMEGFVPGLVNAELRLGEHGLTVSVLCPAGYRVETDRAATRAKVRWEPSEVLEHI